MPIRGRVLAILLEFALVSCGFALLPAPVAGEGAFWGGLERGPYGVGFRAVEEYDYSRSFAAKRDYFGAPIEGERARPIQICLWYPARPSGEEPSMVYGEYAIVYPEDDRFFSFLSGLQDREVGTLYRVFNGDQSAIMELMSAEAGAVRNAPAAGGIFPLIVYIPSFNHGIAENAVLCEFLASYGFAVVMTHAYGPAAYASEPFPSHLEILIGDVQYALGAAHEFSVVDGDNLGVMGYGAGATAALLLQMRNLYVDAVLALEPGFINAEYMSLATGNPYYDEIRMNVPLIQMCGPLGGDRDLSIFHSLIYSTRYSLEFPELEVLGLSTYGLMRADLLGGDESVTEAVHADYEIMCDYALNFFDAHLKGSDDALEFLDGEPVAAGPDKEPLRITRSEGEDVPPTPEQFIGILAERGIETAIDIYRRFRAKDPDIILFNELRMNYAGYGLLQRGLLADAIEAFKMNAETFPQSSNCWDSLAEAYVANGDSVQATACYRKVLEVLPNDPRADERVREILRGNAERYLEASGTGSPAEQAEP